MPISLHDIDHISKLAYLAMTDAEKSLLTKQLDDILAYANQLDAVDTSKIEPTAHAIPQQTVFREDVPHSFCNTPQLLANAPEAEDGYFAVPKI